jgi:hypothetical protein
MSEYNNQRDETVFDKVKEAMDELFKVMNIMGNNTPVKDAVKASIQGEHRTLQQAFFRNIIVGSVEAFADMDEEGRTDLRNKASCECATKLIPILDNTSIPMV